MGRFILLVALFFATYAVLVSAQSCENGGVLNSDGTSCQCPPGFGGSTCSLPGCGGDIFQGTNRKLVQAPTSGSPAFANLTSGSCTCADGWGGFGCNVCQSASACQSGFARINGGTTTQGSLPGLTSPGQTANGTLVCNSAPRVWAASEMSCSVVNPLLQNVFPGNAQLNILRTLNPSLSPSPNVSSFGGDGTGFAQLWLDGVEQFYCSADQCSQTVNSDDGSSSDYSCNGLSCACRNGTTMCGGSTKLVLTGVINQLSGELTISCDSSSCSFKQSILQNIFGQDGLALSSCSYGECVSQSAIDQLSSSGTGAGNHGSSLSGGVVAGLAVVGALIGAALLFLLLGCMRQRKARATPVDPGTGGGVGIVWKDVSYAVPGSVAAGMFSKGRRRSDRGFSDEKVILDNVSGHIAPGEMMAILGPSGAGKTTLVEILARKAKTGYVSGQLAFPSASTHSIGRTTQNPRIAFVPQQDVLPPTLTVREALLFSASLRLPESMPKAEKAARVDELIEQLGLMEVANSRIGDKGKRGVSGGEMRRVSIGLELVGNPDVLILDEPTSGLDSVSAARVAAVLYHTFDHVLLLAHGRALYSGRGGMAPAEHLVHVSDGSVSLPPEGYNIADHLLDVASDPPATLFQHAYRSSSRSRLRHDPAVTTNGSSASSTNLGDNYENEKGGPSPRSSTGLAGTGGPVPASLEKGGGQLGKEKWWSSGGSGRPGYAATFLTQFQVLAGREWKVLRRDKTLFVTHIGVSCILGVFCGGLYFKTDTTISGFQSRVGCLFFLGALIAFSALSALYNVVETRPLFLRERSNSYYRPTAWLLSRIIFDVIPLRLIPTIIVSSITYWMADLAEDAALFFKFLLILVLYSLCMTLFNFLLGCLFTNGGVAILLSALTALYQMTFAGFFVHLADIPQVLRWLQWFCPLKYALEALSVNEVGSGLMIQDTLEGVPVTISASLIMELLFGFGANNYYRDVLVLFAFIAGFALGIVAVVWLKVRERR